MTNSTKAFVYSPMQRRFRWWLFREFFALRPGFFPPARGRTFAYLYRTRIHADRDMIPDADIWRAATLMLKRYGESAQSESASRADELAAEGDHEARQFGG